MKDTNIFSGHAQLPSGSDIYETYKYISIIVAVDMDTGMIVDCDVPILCKLSNDFISDIIKGNSFDDGIAQIIKTIDSRVHMLSKKALINALQVVHNRYMIIKEKARN